MCASPRILCSLFLSFFLTISSLTSALSIMPIPNIRLEFLELLETIDDGNPGRQFPCYGRRTRWAYSPLSRRQYNPLEELSLLFFYPYQSNPIGESGRREIGSSPVLYLYSTYVTRDRMCDLPFNSFIRDRPLFSSLKRQTVLCRDNESTSRKIRPQGQYIFTIQHGVY